MLRGLACDSIAEEPPEASVDGTFSGAWSDGSIQIRLEQSGGSLVVPTRVGDGDEFGCAILTSGYQNPDNCFTESPGAFANGTLQLALYSRARESYTLVGTTVDGGQTIQATLTGLGNSRRAFAASVTLRRQR